ncbi:MAG: hypothetical protein BalsKO_16690 [Balneolaceae bacterium]
MEQRKNNVLNSLEGIERATPPIDTFDKIRFKIKEQKSETNSRIRVQMMAVAAAILIAVCCNIFFITNYMSSNTETTSQVEYSEIISSYNLY